ncbi:MAG: hypothetical protein IKM40_01090 [Clostridia bacterium]|nr:hypothetical protein [Clostridia bacterium]
MKKDLIKKLSSRKFWAAVSALITALCVLFGVDELTLEKLTAVMGALSVLAVYIFTEGRLDERSMKVNDEKSEED